MDFYDEVDPVRLAVMSAVASAADELYEERQQALARMIRNEVAAMFNG